MKKKISIPLLLAFFIGACGGSKDVDKIGDAQLCLDGLRSGATAAQANECIVKVDGISSSGAEGIRCSGGFIREGFSDVNRYIAAFNAMGSSTGGSNVQQLMSLLAFTSAGAVTTDFSDASSTFYSCYASYAKGPTLLASFSYFTMGLMNYFVAKGGASCSSTPTTSSSGYKYYDLTSCMTNVSNIAILATLVDKTTSDAAAVSAQSSIGSVIVATYNLSCSGSVGANVQLCTVLGNAITNAGGASNTRGVATQFFTGIQ